MKVLNCCRTTFLLLAVITLALVVGGCAEAGSADTDSNSGNTEQSSDNVSYGGNENPYDELQLGSEVFDELKERGELVESSPLYDSMLPIADTIGKTAQPQYDHPFKFYLVHEEQSNAFSAPGGNVYVTDTLLYDVKHSEELAGVLCHEVSHTIHHDTVNLMKEKEKIWRRQVAADLILGHSFGRMIAIGFLGHLGSLGYSRNEEEQADLSGADICAQAGYNPWGLIWFFRAFENADKRHVPELLSDHPDTKRRIQTLEKHFREHPEMFKKFDPDPSSGAPFSVPANAAEAFMR